MAHTRFTVLIINLLLCLWCSAEVAVRGRVTERATSEPVAGVMLTVRDATDRAMAFAASDADGLFAITYQPADSVWLVASSMGYAPYRQLLSGRDETVDVVLDEGSIQLREVSVKADRVRGEGDTVTYHVGSFARSQDRSIGDVMKRMPGINVDDAGRIQYQGRDISKFYIEGEDLLGGRYGIATNGVAHSDIGAVEILENHQAMQVLRGLSLSTDVAVNLKLKDKAKATVAAHGTAGSGYSPQPRGALWLADALAMLAGGGYQFITTVKSNNTGADIISELTDFTAGQTDDRLKSYLSIDLPATPGLKLNRTYFNRSTAVSTNHLWKAGRESSMRLRLDGWSNRVASSSQAVTTYYLESGDRVIAEQRDALSHSDAISAAFDVEVNRSDYYLSNTLEASVGRTDVRLDMSGSIDNSQSARLPDINISNSLKAVRRSGARLLTIESLNSWQRLPQRLIVEQSGSAYGQRVAQQAFVTDQKASFGLSLGRLHLSMAAGLGGTLRSVRARTPYQVAIPDAAGSLNTDYLRLYLSPESEWQAGSLSVRLRVPLAYYLYHFTAGLPSRQRIYASPSLSLNWPVTPMLTLGLTASARRSPMPLHDLHHFVTLTDYRTLSRGTDAFYSSSSRSLSLRAAYKKPRRGLFANAMLLLLRRNSPWRLTLEFVGDYLINGFEPVDGKSTLTTGNANFGKTLDFMNGGISLGASFIRSTSTVLSDGTALRNRTLSYTISPAINGAVASMLNWNYRFDYSLSRLHAGPTALPALSAQVHTLGITATPWRPLTAGIDGEFYHTEISSGRYKDMTMIDARLTVSLTRRIDLECRVNNLLDRRSYAYTTYGTLSSWSCRSQLRGRELLITLSLKR